MHLTPVTISCLMYIHYMPSWAPLSPAQYDAVETLIRHALIEKGFDPNDPSKPVYETTARGRAHIHQLTRLALPVLEERWVDGHGNLIDMENAA